MAKQSTLLSRLRILRYEIIKYLEDLDKGDPFVSDEDKWKNELVKETTNIIKKIKLLRATFCKYHG